MSVCSAVLNPTDTNPREETFPMIATTTAPPWLRRSDQAVTWARTMPSSTARQQISRGRLLAGEVIRTG